MDERIGFAQVLEEKRKIVFRYSKALSLAPTNEGNEAQIFESPTLSKSAFRQIPPHLA